jgi:hypothetical protein
MNDGLGQAYCCFGDRPHLRNWSEGLRKLVERRFPYAHGQCPSFVPSRQHYRNSVRRHSKDVSRETAAGFRPDTGKLGDGYA